MKVPRNLLSELKYGLPLWALALGMGLALPQAVLAQEAEEDGTFLGTIVLTASGFAQALPDAPATMTVIEGDEIAKRPYASIVDALRNVPGVVIGSAGGKTGLPTISMRGMDSSYVLMLVDGKPVGNSREATYNGWGSGMSESYLPPPSTIERIEVIRGPMSSLYGTAASGGVINVITKPVEDYWSGSVTLGTTSYEDSNAGNSHEGRFYLSGPIIADKLGLSVFGSIHDREGDRTFAGGSDGWQIYDNTRKSLGGRLVWSMNENNKLTFEHILSDNSSARSSETTGTSGGGMESKRKNSSVTHVLSWGDGFETTSFLNYEDVHNQEPNDGNDSGYKQLNFNTKTALSLGAHDMVVGFDWRDEETRHDPARLPVGVDPVMTRSQWAVFAEDNYHLTDDLTLTFGLRYDDNERYGSHITPRLYAVWHASDSLTIKGGVSGGYKVPQLKQADSNILEPAGRGRGWDMGNSNLKPEESTNFEIGAIYEADSGLQLGMTVYHTKFSDKIDRDRVCEDPVGLTCNGREYINQYVNRDEAELDGVEVTLDHAFGDFDLGASYTYSDSKITKGPGEGDRFNRLPQHVVNLSLDWDATAALTVWGNAQYRSATKDADTSTSFVPEHALFDLGVDYEFNDTVTGTLGIYNLGNETFDAGYNDGRSVYLGLTSTF